MQGEPSPVPSLDRIWAYDDESIFPTRPESPQEHSKEPVEGYKVRLWMFALQDCELLPQNKVFEQETAARAEYSKNRGKNYSNEEKHGWLTSQTACAK